MARKTQIDRLLGQLLTGKNVTVAEARKRFGVKRFAARVFELRNKGFRIYTNKVNVGGRKVTAYRLDTNLL